MSWDIKNPLAVLEKGSLEYTTRIDALYEFLKNHIEADAYHIYLDIDTINKTLIITGDGKGLDANDLHKNVCSVAQSKKDMAHHGLGQIHAFLRLASKFAFISKKAGTLSIVNCVPINERLEDEIPPREMTVSDIQLFGKYIGRLKKWDHGTVVVLEGVGQRSSKVHDFTFKMKEEFEEKTLIKKLQEKLQQELEMRKIHLKINDDKVKRIPAKIGQGKKINFMMPSKAYPYRKEDAHVFEYVGRKFAMFLTFSLRVSTHRQNEPIWLSQEGKDNITLDTAFRDKRNISHTVFYNSQYAPYLSGHVSFKIKPLDKEDLPSFYSGSRQNIIVDSTFGHCLINMLMYASVSYIQPLMLQYLEEKQSSKDERRSHSLTDDLSSFFRAHSDVASEIFQQSEGTVPLIKIRCRSCDTNSEPVRVSIEQLNGGPWEDSKIYLCGESYRCGNCGAMWDRQHRGPNPDTVQKKPFYTPPKPGEGSTERKKRRGYGYSCIVMKFLGDTVNRWKQDRPHEILINSGHPDYRKFRALESKRAYYPSISTLYERRVALKAIIQLEYTNASPTARWDLYEKCHEQFLYWLLESSKADKIDAEPQVQKPAVKSLPSKPVSVRDLSDKWGAKLNL